MSFKSGSVQARVLQTGRLTTQIIIMVCLVLGLYGSVHIFGLPNYVFWISIVLGGMFFCGWGCPFGALQEWVRWIGKKIFGVTWNLPPRIHNYLSICRYVLRAIVLFGIVWPPLNARRTMLSSHYGWEVDVISYAIMGSLLALALFMDRPYCKYLCGFGGEFSLLGILRPFTIKRNEHKCVRCGKCDSACPMGIAVSATANLRDPRCINCFKCVTSCPVEEAIGAGLSLPRLGFSTATKTPESVRKNGPQNIKDQAA